jgi:MarR family transcriptional regulator, organic hydroperoxide resistance regulator
MAEAREDGALADEAWGGIMALMGVQRRRVMAAARGEGLSMPQAFAFLHLDADDPPAMRDLAGALQCDASFVTGIVDRLEALGLAERRVSSADRRVKELVLTPAGRTAQARMRRVWKEAPAVVRELSARDLRDLHRIAGRLAAGIAPDEGSPFARMHTRRPAAGAG